MNPLEKTFSVVVFPLLKTSRPVRLGPLKFRPTDDLDGLPEDQAASVTEITGMLFALGDQRIKHASYAVVDRLDLGGTPPGLESLGDIEAVVGYLYAAPRHEFNDLFLTPEHASILVLTPSQVPVDLVRLRSNVIDMVDYSDLDPAATGFVDGYEGVLGLRHYLWVVSRSRVYSLLPHPTLNIAQDLASDVERATDARADYRLLLELLKKPDRGGDIGQRVFTAVRWFNRANSEFRDDAESCICLSVALETLLRVPHDAKQNRFVDAIALLLGRVPRLEDWATQFYEARSRVVHEGNVGQVAFVAGLRKRESTTTYQSLLAYGREVFQLCLGTVLTGASLSENADLTAKLVTNSERFETVCRILNDGSLPVAVRLQQVDPLARAIHRYRYVPDTGLTTSMMLSACRAAANLTLRSRTDIGEELRKDLTALVKAPRTDSHFEMLDALHALVEGLRRFPDHAKPPLSFAVTTLVQDVWHYTLPHYISLKRRGDADVAANTSVG